MSAGVKHDQEKPLLALIPPEAIEEEGWVWTFGARKYGLWNWKKGLVYTRIISAMMRHTVALLRGEDTDPESGKLHAAHIRCCAGMLIKFQKDGRIDLDDRDKENVELSKTVPKVETNIKAGDLICSLGNEDASYEAMGIYYDESLKPFLFFRDNNGQIFSGNVNEYKRVSNVKVIENAGN